MKAMILAAGKGTRVRPLTYTIPKPMIPILGKPLIAFLIELLRQHRFDQIMINTSHLANEIERYIGDGQLFGVDVAYSFEGRIVDGDLLAEPLGTAGGMRKIQDFAAFFDDTFVVLCGDGLIDLNLTDAVRWHREKGSIATVITKSISREKIASHGVVVTDENSRVRIFQVKPDVDEALSNIADTGIYIFEPEVFDYIPSGVEYDITSQLFQNLLKCNAPFYGVEMDFEWIDIGNTPNYWLATCNMLRGEIKNVRIPGQEVAPGIYVGLGVMVNWDKVDIQGPAYIGGMTRIENGARIIGPSVIGQNCWICNGATIDSSVIFEYTRAMEGVRLIDKLVFGPYCVDKTGASINFRLAGLDWLIRDSRSH
jgi:mannose-1-phosphate guanylyltransferase